mmetsp:Transcript_62364/g.147816  ORF Transcript_62364/g.147816 Transcript_62364/m.147816 type:complete len:295 (+) Transcript_62364:145-1029(+)
MGQPRDVRQDPPHKAAPLHAGDVRSVAGLLLCGVHRQVLLGGHQRHLQPRQQGRPPPRTRHPVRHRDDGGQRGGDLLGAGAGGDGAAPDDDDGAARGGQGVRHADHADRRRPPPRSQPDPRPPRGPRRRGRAVHLSGRRVLGHGHGLARLRRRGHRPHRHPPLPPRPRPAPRHAAQRRLCCTVGQARRDAGGAHPRAGGSALGARPPLWQHPRPALRHRGLLRNRPRARPHRHRDSRGAVLGRQGAVSPCSPHPVPRRRGAVGLVPPARPVGRRPAPRPRRMGVHRPHAPLLPR